MNSQIPVIGFVSREDYADFCKVCVDFPKIAPRYDDWLKRINQQLEALRAQGIFPNQVNIKPLEMLAWCKERGIPVDSRGRIGYATWLYTRQQQK